MSGDEQQHEYHGDVQTDADVNMTSGSGSEVLDSESPDAVEVPIVDEEGSADEIAVEAAVAETADESESVPADPAEASQQDVENQDAVNTEALQRQVEDLTGQYMRIAADFDNFRKRTAREKSELEQRVKCDTISELLPVIDSFERAKSHINPQTEQEIGIQKSYQGVYKQLVDCLKRIGVAPMRAKGTPFDPNLHEAVMREPTDEFEEGAVVEELVNGYMLGDLVLRHAMVKVAAPPEPVMVSEEASPEALDSQGVE